jgi:transcriptional regulator with XRE-family HTH domain
MEQQASAPPDGPVGALLRAFRHRACLSQEQLAERAELSERTVRNLEAGRVRSPRPATVRLLADALELGEPERENWFAAARDANGRQAEPAIAGAGGPTQFPRRLTVAVLTGDGQDASGLAITCRIDKAGETVLAVQCALLDAVRYPARLPACLVLVSSPHQFNDTAARDGLPRITLDKLAPAR